MYCFRAGGKGSAMWCETARIQNVTCKHAFDDIDELLEDAARFLRRLDRRPQREGLSQLRKAM